MSAPQAPGNRIDKSKQQTDRDSIRLDYPAATLELFFDIIHVSKPDTLLKAVTLTQTIALLRLTDAYGCETWHSTFLQRLYKTSVDDCFQVFNYAAETLNSNLASHALSRSHGFLGDQTVHFGIWLNRLPADWQTAFMRSVLCNGGGWDLVSRVASWEKVAAGFTQRLENRDKR